LMERRRGRHFALCEGRRTSGGRARAEKRAARALRATGAAD